MALSVTVAFGAGGRSRRGGSSSSASIAKRWPRGIGAVVAVLTAARRDRSGSDSLQCEARDWRQIWTDLFIAERGVTRPNDKFARLNFHHGSAELAHLAASVVSRNWLVFRCAQNGLGQGATREHSRSAL